MNMIIKWILTVISIILIAVLLGLGYCGYRLANFFDGFDNLVGVAVLIGLTIFIWAHPSK